MFFVFSDFPSDKRALNSLCWRDEEFKYAIRPRAIALKPRGFEILAHSVSLLGGSCLAADERRIRHIYILKRCVCFDWLAFFLQVFGALFVSKTSDF